MIVSTVTVPHPSPNAADTFRPDHYAELVGQCVTGIPGLAEDHDHLCTGVTISDDGRTATLTVHTQPPPMPELVRTLAGRYGPPVAHVRAIHHETGDVIVEGRYDAPLATGQQVYIGGEPHIVVEESWPHRDPKLGGVPTPETLDWQHAVVRPVGPVEPQVALPQFGGQPVPDQRSQ